MMARMSLQLVRIEGRYAIFSLEDGKELAILKQNIEPLEEIGSNYVLTVLPEKEALLEQNQLAKSLLNQILTASDAQAK
jgi:hypothetical protein